MGTLLSLSDSENTLPKDPWGGGDSTHKDDGRLCNPRLGLHILRNRFPISQFNNHFTRYFVLHILIKETMECLPSYTSIKTTLGYISLEQFF